MGGSARAVLLGAGLSLAAHGGVAIVVMRLPLPSAPLPSAPDPIEIEIGDAETEPPEQAILSSHRRWAAPLLPGGRQSDQNIDSDERGGRGDPTGALEFIFLLPRDDRVTLQDSPMTAYGRAQAQRIHTASIRASHEDRRATPQPSTAPFLASGSGDHRERRPVAAIDPRSGARQATAASRQGTDEPQQIDASGPQALATRNGMPALVGPRGNARVDANEGGPEDSPGRGIQRGRGRRESSAARVAHDRPPVDRGPAATPTNVRARPSDTTDSELLAASMVQSMVEATQRSGQETGPGRGGSGLGSNPGSGEEATEGGRAHSDGPDSGALSLDTRDARYNRWQVSVVRAIYRSLRFPRERALAMDQGWAVYAFRVRRDGSLAGTPRRTRSSGFGDIDQATLDAILRAELPAVPEQLFPDETSLPVSVRISLSNPMVN